jgi:hypothetical protein
VDLNNDGYMDIVSGKYLPNDIIWFKGSKKGFEKGIIIKEDREKFDKKCPLMSFYISAPHFVDIDGDKDLDMFISGGANQIYFNRNIGTPENPKFGKRKTLTTIKGDTIGNSHPSIAIFDWDNDNILDIVISGDCENEKEFGLSYYKGLGNLKFESKVPIVKNQKNQKYIPGFYHWMCLTDWNNDEKPDFLIGAGLLCENGKVLDKANNFVDHMTETQEQDDMMKLMSNEIQFEGLIYLLLGE